VRRLGLVLLAAAVAIGLASATAVAHWAASGSATGSGHASTLRPPTDVAAVAGGDEVAVTWTASSTASAVAPDGYRVYRVAAGGARTVACAAATGTSCLDAGVPEGTYRYAVQAVFRSWTAEATSAPVTVEVADTVAPATSDDTASTGSAWRSEAATVTLTAVDTGGSGVAATYYTTDGSLPTTASAVYDPATRIVLSAQGTYTVRYFSVDGAGNAEAVRTASTQIRIDRTRPATTDDAVSAWTNGSRTVTLTAVDTGGSGVAATYYTTDGSAPTTASALYDPAAKIVLSAEGVHTVRYFSVDAAGNAEPVRTAAEVRIDRTAPATSDDTASIGSGWRSQPATVTLTPSDGGGSGVDRTHYTTDGSTPTTASPVYSAASKIVLSADGVHTVRYFTVDAAGNAEPVRTAATQIRIDRTAPVTTDDAVSTWTNGSRTVTLTASDGSGSGVDKTVYTTDGSVPTNSSQKYNPATKIVLSAEGTYTIRYFSIDAAGNAESVKTAANQVRIDKTAPAAALNLAFPLTTPAYTSQTWKTGSQAACGLSGNTMGFCGTASDSGGSGVAKVEVQVRRSSNSTCWTGSGATWNATCGWQTATGTAAWTQLFEASSFPVARNATEAFTVSARATDAAGNVTAPVASRGFSFSG
jgi:hypothetical protein